LLNLIDHLPRHSFFNEARANDPELAEFLANQEPAEHQERLSNWNSEVEILAIIADRLTLVANVIARTAGATSDLRIDPIPRPVTEMQRARERHEREREKAIYRRLVDKLVPQD
jgi:hypothetical protein